MSSQTSWGKCVHKLVNFIIRNIYIGKDQFITVQKWIIVSQLRHLSMSSLASHLRYLNDCNWRYFYYLNWAHLYRYANNCFHAISFFSKFKNKSTRLFPYFMNDFCRILFWENFKFVGLKYIESAHYQTRAQFVYLSAQKKNYVNHCRIKERFFS